jgi:Kef-type K+ transport system membrane component KefB
LKKVVLFSFLLVLGLALSQFLSSEIHFLVRNLSLIFLAFIMIHVGIEFSIDKSRVKQYGWDYFVAFTAATLPWIFCALYFIYFFQHAAAASKWDIWTDALLLARFAAPTSAGILFSMMAAAGLEATWMFKKARILAIFDDLDTIILLIPIKMMIVGFRWEAFGLLGVIASLIYLAWRKMHSIAWPIRWYWVLIYSIVLALLCEGLHFMTVYLGTLASLQLEILLPAFILGCVLAYPSGEAKLHTFFSSRSEKMAKLWIGALFVFFVGLSMPAMGAAQNSAALLSFSDGKFWDYKIGTLGIGEICWHVLAITVLSNLGKMFPLFCYRKEASWKERLALAIGMWPRGEVGAGVLILALGLVTYLAHTLIMIAMLSLALNLILTGPFIMIIKKLLQKPVMN